MGSVPIILSRALSAVAGLFLAAMVLLTVADVLLRALFGYPVRGMLELIELGLACTVFLGLPAVFLRNANLVVDVIDQMAGAGVVCTLELLGALVSLGVLAVMAWQMLPVARGMHEFGDVTPDLSIPRIYYWIPVLAGVVASAAASVVIIVRWRRRP
jgi:TRAP-type C4-dicarboxylate transport system permease small subunit